MLLDHPWLLTSQEGRQEGIMGLLATPSHKQSCQKTSDLHLTKHLGLITDIQKMQGTSEHVK